MIDENLIRDQLGNTLNEINLPNLGKRYEGKVRENYINDATGVRTIISTDRLSAFDRVITTIPFKGQLLNQMSAFWFEKTKHIAPNHIIDIPDVNAVRAHNCKTLPVEMIVRAYITGSAWRAYQKGESVSGIIFPEGLKNYQKLFQYIMVDEFQDTNVAQARFLTLLYKKGHNRIMIVGDDDQGIYSFRGACVDNILDFDKWDCFRDDSVRNFYLSVNFRSGPQIIDSVQRIISENKRRFEKVFTAYDDKKESAVFFNIDQTLEDEAKSIAEYIKDIINNIFAININIFSKFNYTGYNIKS